METTGSLGRLTANRSRIEEKIGETSGGKRSNWLRSILVSSKRELFLQGGALSRPALSSRASKRAHYPVLCISNSLAKLSHPGLHGTRAIRVTWPTERSLATQRSENDRTTVLFRNAPFAYALRFVIYEIVATLLPSI